MLLLMVLSVLSLNARAAECPPDMVAVADFCMDRYEAPNEQGEFPITAQRAQDGEKWCNARGKRLCSETEWVRACEGTAGNLYPYGKEYQRHRCNDDKEWINPNWSKVAKFPSATGQAEVARLYQGDRSGSRQGCVSEEGVYDLTGNAAEWVKRSVTVPGVPNHDHVLKGCYWAGCYGGSRPSCKFANRAHPGNFRTYEAGFRCCQN